MAQQMRVFVSHSSADNAFCHALVRALRAAGADVWYDEHNLGAGVLRDEIMKELATRPVFVVVISKAAFASRWVRDECEWAYNIALRKSERLLLPVVSGAYDPNDFDMLLFIESLRRVEAPDHQPYQTAEAIERTLRLLALTPAGTAPAPTTPQPAESVADLIAHGKALAIQGMYAKALPFFERATESDPSLIYAWFNLGLGNSRTGNYARALEAYEHVLALDPNHAVTWNNRAWALMHLGRDDEAISAVERSLRLDRERAATWDTKAQLLNRRGYFDEALTCASRALSIAENGTRWHTKATALRALGRVGEAERRAKELGWQG